MSISAHLMGALGSPVFPYERATQREMLPKTLPNFETEILSDEITELSGSIDLKNPKFKKISGNNWGNKNAYLWIIFNNGIFILSETAGQGTSMGRTRATHTNITGGEKAFVGGELWINDTGKVYINCKSGRYGASSLGLYKAALEIFKHIGISDIENVDKMYKNI